MNKKIRCVHNHLNKMKILENATWKYKNCTCLFPPPRCDRNVPQFPALTIVSMVSVAYNAVYFSFCYIRKRFTLPMQHKKLWNLSKTRATIARTGQCTITTITIPTLQYSTLHNTYFACILYLSFSCPPLSLHSLTEMSMTSKHHHNNQNKKVLKISKISN